MICKNVFAFAIRESNFQLLFLGNLSKPRKLSVISLVLLHFRTLHKIQKLKELIHLEALWLEIQITHV